MSLKFSWFNCHSCGDRAVANYRTDNGEKFHSEYLCMRHATERDRLMRSWESQNFTIETNQHGMRYLKPVNGFVSLWEFIHKQQPEQVKMF